MDPEQGRAASHATNTVPRRQAVNVCFPTRPGWLILRDGRPYPTLRRVMLVVRARRNATKESQPAVAVRDFS